MNTEIVKKIDKDFLERGTREEFRAAILQLLDLVRDQALRIAELERGFGQMQDELRRLKGEKKSPSSSQQQPQRDLLSRVAGKR